jgi:hypothetical protein
MFEHVGVIRWRRVVSLALACPLACTLAGATAFDICGVIPSSAIESAQGAPVLSTKSSQRETGGLTIAHCYYMLANQAQSVSLEVTLPGSEAATRSHPRQYWRTHFGRDREIGEGEAREQERDASAEVSGLGREALFEGNGPVGALYVLDGDRFLRISIGSSADPASRVEKSKALARAALAGLAKRRRNDR